MNFYPDFKVALPKKGWCGRKLTIMAIMACFFPTRKWLVPSKLLFERYMTCVQYCWVVQLLYHVDCYSEVCVIHLYSMFLCQTNASQVVWGRAWCHKSRRDTRSMALWLLQGYTLVNQHGWLENGQWEKVHGASPLSWLLVYRSPCCFFSLTGSCGLVLWHSKAV